MEKILKQPAKLNNSQKVKMMTRIAILTAIATVLYRIEIPILVGHLKLDPAVIPALVGGIMMGPLAGIAIEFLKNAINLFVTSSGGVGELINFIVGTSLIVPVTLIYRRNPSKKSFIIGSVFSVISILIIGAICNYLLTPVFYAVLGLGEPSHAEIMGFVGASFALNGLKSAVTLIPTFSILPVMKKLSI